MQTSECIYETGGVLATVRDEKARWREDLQKNYLAILAEIDRTNDLLTQLRRQRDAVAKELRDLEPRRRKTTQEADDA
jgi:hypothetical protein